VTGDFTPRGGIKTTVTATYDKVSTENEDRRTKN
jgi:NADPH-dependent 7-cyano-7-deazaguanine reductase QueF